MILDIATVLAIATRDWAAARALPPHVIGNSYCKTVYILWEMIAPLPYPSNARLDHHDLCRSLLWLYVMKICHVAICHEDLKVLCKKMWRRRSVLKRACLCLHELHPQTALLLMSQQPLSPSNSFIDLDFFRLKGRYLKVCCLFQSFICRGTGPKNLRGSLAIISALCSHLRFAQAGHLEKLNPEQLLSETNPE